MVEGPHLVAAALAAGIKPLALVATEAALTKPEISKLVAKSRIAPMMLDATVFAAIADADQALKGMREGLEDPRLIMERLVLGLCSASGLSGATPRYAA